VRENEDQEALSGPWARPPLRDVLDEGEIFSAPAFEDKASKVPDELGVWKDQPLSAFFAYKDGVPS
jgi:hypothetical protein